MFTQKLAHLLISGTRQKHMDGYGSFCGNGSSAILTIADFLLFMVFLNGLSNLYSLHTQTQRGLVSNTGDQGDAIISHLIEVREIRVGDRTNECHFVGLRADCGLVLNNVPILHILQLSEVWMIPSVVAEQANIPGVEGRKNCNDRRP